MEQLFFDCPIKVRAVQVSIDDCLKCRKYDKMTISKDIIEVVCSKPNGSITEEHTIRLYPRKENG